MTTSQTAKHGAWNHCPSCGREEHGSLACSAAGLLRPFAMNDQRPLNDQLADLVGIANERGMYDAADYLKGVLDGRRR